MTKPTMRSLMFQRCCTHCRRLRGPLLHLGRSPATIRPCPRNNDFHLQRQRLATATSRAQKGSWSNLSPSQQEAWKVFHYNKDSWEGRQPAPKWKKWSDLTLEEKSAAMNGLNVRSREAWDALAPSQKDPQSSSSSSTLDIPPLSSLLEEEEEDSTASSSNALVVAQETRLARQQQQQQAGGALGNLAYQAVKGLAPVVGPIVSLAARGGGRGSLGLHVVGGLLENLPAMMDASSGVLDVTGIDTLVYLDDSGSMKGSNLQEGQAALKSLETRLKKAHEGDQRFLPTRIVKFGNHSTVLNPSEEEWSVSLVNAAWDGSSGGTYMWKMIQDDIQNKYRPAGGKLRVIVITDGYDNWSPEPYRGVRGFDPLMSTLLNQGYDIEWNIIVVGNKHDSGLFMQQQQQPELSREDQKLYESLCRATGGQFLSLGTSGWNEEDTSISDFLDAVEDSGYHDSKQDRLERQEQYLLEARKGKAENFDWLPNLPKGDDNDDKK